MKTKSDIPQPGDVGSTELVVETIKASTIGEFDRQIKKFYDTYVDVKVLGYSVDHTKKSYKRTFVMTLSGILFDKKSF